MAEHLVPVAVTRRPFLCCILACQIEHLFQWAVTGEHAFCLCHFPVLAVQPFNHVCRVHYAPDFVRKLKERADILPVVLPVADGIRVFLSPFLSDIGQCIQACLLARGIIYHLEVRRELLQVAVVHIFERVAQHVDDAALDLGLGEYGADCLLEAWQAVHAEEQHVLHAAVLQVAQHPHPELGALVGPYRDAEYLLVTLRRDAQHHIGRPAQDSAVLPDLVVDAVHEHERIDRVQGPGLPFPDFRENLVRDLADHLC